MYPIGSKGASQAILEARLVAGCIRRHRGDINVALRRGTSLMDDPYPL
jgi:hypothetical protein